MNAVEIGENGELISNILHPLAIGEPDDRSATSEQLCAVISVLTDAGISCFIVDAWALLYYGTRHSADDRILCIPDEHHERAVELFKTIDILKPCDPHPFSRNSGRTPYHMYPRSKASGRLDFWLLVPASSYHLTCEPANVEWSLGGLPYPKLPVFVQSCIDSKDGVGLEKLIDAMDLSEEWGEENLELDGDTDTEWLKRRVELLRADGNGRYRFINRAPVSRRKMWKEYVGNKQRRLGWKRPPEIYATQYRRHGSKDMRAFQRRGL
ncbi:hypothetical protein AWENTII_007302 [Aspergillus wentii]